MTVAGKGCISKKQKFVEIHADNFFYKLSKKYHASTSQLL